MHVLIIFLVFFAFTSLMSPEESSVDDAWQNCTPAAEAQQEVK